MLALSLALIGVLIWVNQGAEKDTTTNLTPDQIRKKRDEQKTSVAERPKRPTPIRSEDAESKPDSIEVARAHLVDLLLRFNPHGSDGGRSALELLAVEQELLAYLASLPPEYANMVYELIQNEQQYIKRYRLIEGLGWMGGDRAAVLLIDHFRSRVEEEKVVEARRAIRALGLVNNDFSYRLIDQELRTGGPEHRPHFIQSMVWHKDAERAMPLFKDMARTELGVQARNKAAQALKYVGNAESARDVEAMLEAEPVTYVRQTLIGALGKYGDPESLDVLERIAIEDADHVTRMSAVNNVRLIGTPRAVEILEWVAKNDKNERVRSDAESALVKLEDALLGLDK